MVSFVERMCSLFISANIYNTKDLDSHLVEDDFVKILYSSFLNLELLYRYSQTHTPVNILKTP